MNSICLNQGLYCFTFDPRIAAQCSNACLSQYNTAVAEGGKCQDNAVIWAK